MKELDVVHPLLPRKRAKNRDKPRKNAAKKEKQAISEEIDLFSLEKNGYTDTMTPRPLRCTSQQKMDTKNE